MLGPKRRPGSPYRAVIARHHVVLTPIAREGAWKTLHQ